MGFRNIHFYNHYGNGDIYISREFVRDICAKIPAENYYYAHAKNKRILADMPFLKWEPITDRHIMRSYYRVEGDELFVNTWLGVTSRYVTPANSCSIYNSYRMYNDMLRTLGIGLFQLPPIHYLPQQVFLLPTGVPNFELAGVSSFVDGAKVPFILLDTCGVQSNQAQNFDFTPIVKTLVNKYDDKIFVTTTKFDLDNPNLWWAAEITNTSDGFDLNEISYLSLFTDLIIGRSSGPAVFCMNKANSFNYDKTFLSFTYNKYAAHIVDWDIKIPASRIWSDSTTTEKVTQDISSIIEKVYG